MSRVHKGFRTCLLALAVTCASAAADLPTWQFADVERVVALADIHGAYPAFGRTLKSAGVIDAEDHWTAGATHLVVVGDLLDRGEDSRRVMDLVRRLEGEAVDAGGAVHLTLGNHELMNLLGDLRYVAEGEYAAFAAEETAVQRDQAYERYLAVRGVAASDAARETFDTDHPAGFFAHRRAFSLEGEYGAWLVEKPWLVVVNDSAFVHGGLPERVAELGGEGINGRLREQLLQYMRNAQVLVDAGILDVTVSFYDHPQYVERYREAVVEGTASWTPEQETAAANVLQLNDADLFASDSVLWYRGSVGCSVLVEGHRLDRNLAVLGAKRVVIGHTPTHNGRVLVRLDERINRIDTGMLNAFYGGRGAALVIEGAAISVRYEDGEQGEPVAQARIGAPTRFDTNVATIEALLVSGEIVAREALEDGREKLSLAYQDDTVTAYFEPAGKRAKNFPDVAAYRVDRLLDLEMVPIAVLRTIDGVPGTVQLGPAKTVSEAQRVEQRGGGGAWCPLRDQFSAMYLFDALVHNEGRTPERIRYLPGSWDLVLTGHDKAFSTSRGIPRHLQSVALIPTPTWSSRLAAWDKATLTQALGDVLDERRIKALLARRDKLLE